MSTSTISIIVPVYNVEQYLPRCIDSILSQTFTDFELLLIDDGSPDNSGTICDEYAKKDSRIRVFHKENGGVSSARNLGLDNAKGEWIAFCDSDDYVGMNWLNDFHSNKQNADLIISGFYECHKELFYERAIKEEYKGVDELTYLLEKNNFFGYLWCKMFKKELIDRYKIRFNTVYKIWEDVEFIYKYLSHVKEIVNISSLNYFYQYPDFTIKYSNIQNFDCTKSIIAQIDGFFPSSKKKEYLLQKYETDLRLNLMKFYLNKHYKEGYIHLCIFSQFISKSNIHSTSKFYHFHFPNCLIFTHVILIFKSLLAKTNKFSK